MKSISNPLRISYFLRVKNAGDLLNANIVSAVSGRPTYFVRDRGKPFLLPAGSTLASAAETTAVWGAGLMHPDLGLGAAKSENVYLLRGKKTHTALRNAGVNIKDIPLGDPLFLASSIFGVNRSAESQSRIGIMPHYADRLSPLIRRLTKQSGVVDLNVSENPINLLNKIATCDYVISTCLHGLILAESLGIPSLWVKTGKVFAGADYEFSDWFSICQSPQAKPWMLKDSDKLADLVSACQRHHPDIILSDLKKSFPSERISEFEETGLSGPVVPVQECRERAVPVFVISFNRGRMTRNLFNSLKGMEREVDVIIHDNGSDDPNAVRELERLSEEGALIVRRSKISSADDLDNVNETVNEYFNNWAEPQNFIVTDCDICISTCHPDYLEVLSEMLNDFYGVSCVGPMLQIHDVSKRNPLYAHILRAHIKQFWGKLPVFASFGEKTVAFQYSKIDTTFAMHRGGEPFKRLKNGIRTYAPYEARHLDWYEEEQEENYKHSSNSQISHWGNHQVAKRLSAGKLPYDHFFRVNCDEAGHFFVEKVKIDGKDPRIESLEKALQERDGTNTQQAAELAEKLKKAREANTHMRNMIHDKSHRLNKARRERKAAFAEISALRDSTSWRLTAPLRALVGKVRRYS